MDKINQNRHGGGDGRVVKSYLLVFFICLFILFIFIYLILLAVGIIVI